MTALCENAINAFGAVYCALQAFEPGLDDQKMMIKSHGRQCLTDFVDLLSNQALMTTQLISHLWNIAHGSPAPQPPALAAVATFSIILYECHANTTGTYKNGDAKGILIRMLSYHNPRCTSQNICWWASVILANLSFSAVR